MSATKTIERLRLENAALRELVAGSPDEATIGDTLVKAVGEAAGKVDITKAFMDAVMDRRKREAEEAAKA